MIFGFNILFIFENITFTLAQMFVCHDVLSHLGRPNISLYNVKIV